EASPVVVDLIEEGRLRRDLDVVPRRHVVGPLSADPEIRIGRSDQLFGVLVHHALGQRRGSGRQRGRQPLALRGIEHGEALEEGYGIRLIAFRFGPRDLASWYEAV